jgi:hypothetical protein
MLLDFGTKMKALTAMFHLVRPSHRPDLSTTGARFGKDPGNDTFTGTAKGVAVQARRWCFRRPGVALAVLLATTISVARAGAQTGYFHVEQRNGAWWFIDPDGNPMLSIGVNQIAYDGNAIDHSNNFPYRDAVEKLYPDRNTWGLQALARLRIWGFNTIGAWSDEQLFDRDVPYTVILDIAAHSGADWYHGRPLDVYDPQFERTADEISAAEAAPRAGDHWLLGYFSDNELRWGPDWRGRENMLQMYLLLPTNSPGRQHALDFLRQRYHDDIGRLDRAWNIRAKDFALIGSAGSGVAFHADSDAFLGMVATRYFAVCARAIHDADPNHLFLGAKFTDGTPAPAMQASSLADVASIDIYDNDPRQTVRKLYDLSHKPILVAEFAFRAQDSGLPNTRGAGPRVPDQVARARAFAAYVTALESLPEAVGYHWFEWQDEPAQGRFDGENSNYGLVNIQDEPYASFVAAVKAANASAVTTHRASGANAAGQ